MMTHPAVRLETKNHVLVTENHMLQGRIFTDPSCPELSPAERRRVYQAFPATLAALHSVRPADVGLLQYGRAGGYAKRQVRHLLPSHHLQELRLMPG